MTPPLRCIEGAATTPTTGMKTSRLISHSLLLLLLGALHSLSFAPQPLPTTVLPYVALISLSIFIYLLNGIPRARARLRPAFFFGLGNFGLGLYWIYISLHDYGGLWAPLALVAVFAFSALLSLFYVAIAVLQAWLYPYQSLQNNRQAFINAALWASLWTLFEWLRGTVFTGFPWLNIGYGHVDGTLAGWASALGAYGVSWMAAFTAAALACFFQLHRHPAESHSMAADQLPKVKGFWHASGVLIAAFILNLSGLLLHGISWSEPHGAPFFVRLTQGNVEQSMKFDAQRFEQGMQTYFELASLPAKTPQSRPQLIVLPETVIPVFQHRLPAAFWQQWIDLAARQQSTLLLGVPLYDESSEATSETLNTLLTGQYTNSVIAIDADTTVLEIMTLALPHRYDKHHLVPFGEFIPPGFQWFIDLLNIPLGDFHRGAPVQPPFGILDQHIAPNICYEDVFGEEILRSLQTHAQPGPTLLLNISNLGWFGDTWALRQHLQISRLRAIETARPMLRSTNTGITAVIDPDGVVRAMLEQHTVGVLDVEVQGYSGQTPYMRWGNSLILAISLLLSLSIGLQKMIGRKKRVL